MLFKLIVSIIKTFSLTLSITFPYANSSGATWTPTLEPTHDPSKSPTDKPTNLPTTSPSKKPTTPPTLHPIRPPSVSPTDSPTTMDPTQSPTLPKPFLFYPNYLAQTCLADGLHSEFEFNFFETLEECVSFEVDLLEMVIHLSHLYFRHSPIAHPCSSSCFFVLTPVRFPVARQRNLYEPWQC